MSAYMVEQDHINYLVNAALSRSDGSTLSWVWDVDTETGNYKRGDLQSGRPNRATEIGQMLWDENRKSIEERYVDTRDDFSKAPGPVGEDYRYEYQVFPHYHPDQVQILKACDCFEYQACEHCLWHSSQAKAFIDALRKRAVGDLDGYDNAYWGAPSWAMT